MRFGNYSAATAKAAFALQDVFVQQVRRQVQAISLLYPVFLFYQATIQLKAAGSFGIFIPNKRFLPANQAAY